MGRVRPKKLAEEIEDMRRGLEAAGGDAQSLGIRTGHAAMSAVLSRRALIAKVLTLRKAQGGRQRPESK